MLQKIYNSIKCPVEQSFTVSTKILSNTTVFNIDDIQTGGSRGLMLESRTRGRKVASSSLGPAGNVQRSQYHDWCSLEQGTEPPTAPQAPQHERLPTLVSWSLSVLRPSYSWLKFQHWGLYLRPYGPYRLGLVSLDRGPGVLIYPIYPRVWWSCPRQRGVIAGGGLYLRPPGWTLSTRGWSRP